MKQQDWKRKQAAGCRRYWNDVRAIAKANSIPVNSARNVRHETLKALELERHQVNRDELVKLARKIKLPKREPKFDPPFDTIYVSIIDLLLINEGKTLEVRTPFYKTNVGKLGETNAHEVFRKMGEAGDKFFRTWHPKELGEAKNRKVWSAHRYWRIAVNFTVRESDKKKIISWQG